MVACLLLLPDLSPKLGETMQEVSPISPCTPARETAPAKSSPASSPEARETGDGTGSAGVGCDKIGEFLGDERVGEGAFRIVSGDDDEDVEP